MSGDSEATSERSLSVCKGAGYDEVYPSGHGPEEGSSRFLEREPSAHSLDDEEDFDGEGIEEEDEYDEEEGENEEYEAEGDEEKGENEEYEGEGDGGEDEGDRRAFEEGSLGSSRDGYTRPCIFPMI